MATDISRRKLAADILQMTERELSKRLSDDDQKERIKRLLSVKETENLTGVSYFTLRRQMKTGKLKATRIGRSLHFHPDDVQNFLNECRQEDV